MHSIRPSLAALAALSLAACGGGGKPPPTKSVVMNGVVTLFPPAAAFFPNPTDITRFQLDVLDPVKVLLGQGTAAARVCSPAQPLSLTAVPLQPLPTGSYTCSIPDATLILLGVVGNVIDNNAIQIQTFTTSSGLHLPFCADAACANVTPGQVFDDTAPAVIVPDAFHAAVGALYTPPRTLPQLKGTGVIVVFVVDPTSQPPQPIPGATVTAPGNYTVFYPDFGAPGAGTVTDTSGVAYVTGPPTTLSPIDIAASAPGLPTCATPTSTSCLPPTQAGLLQQLAFVAVVARQ